MGGLYKKEKKRAKLIINYQPKQRSLLKLIDWKLPFFLLKYKVRGELNLDITAAHVPVLGMF